MMTNTLIILWIASIGADRVDFAFGKAGFTITPFIMLSGIIVIGHVVKNIVKCSVPVYSIRNLKKIVWPSVMLAFFLILIFLSVLFAKDLELGSKRLTLLSFELFFVAIMTQMLLTRDYCYLITKGSQFGILLFLLFDVIQLVYWFSPSFAQIAKGFDFVNVIPPSYGLIAPRPSGFSQDMNRGGILLVFYFSNILLFGKNVRHKSYYLSLAFILLIVTFSRSAIISFLIFTLSYLLLKRKEIRWRTVAGYTFAIIVSFIALLVAIQGQSSLDLTKLMSERVTFSSSSSGGEHIDLLNKGIATFSESVKTMTVGIGFGSAYTVLTDFFDFNKNSNFHSLYISLLAETGFVTLIIVIILLITPTFMVSQYTPLLIALIFFNLFYQMTLEPAFWLIILWSWTRLGCHFKSESHRLNRLNFIR